MGRYGWIANFTCALLVLLGGLAVGIAIADWIDALPTQSLPSVDPVAAKTSVHRSGWDLFGFILRRNMAVFVLLLFGLVSGGLVTVVVLLGNGIAIGQIIGFARASGMSVGDLANLLLPHGVLELGALCVAGAVGFQGVRLALSLPAIDRESLKALQLGPVLAFGIGALGVAAAVESFVTADIAESLRRRG